MEPPEPFQSTTWTPQERKSYENIKGLNGMEG